MVNSQFNILVVDDDEGVVYLMNAMLEHLDYKVEMHTSSLEAFKALQRHPDQYDLVISDLTMPNMTGLDLSKRLQEIRSGIPIIIITGYGDNINHDIEKHSGIKKVLQKPVRTEEVASAIREVLDQ